MTIENYAKAFIDAAMHQNFFRLTRADQIDKDCYLVTQNEHYAYSNNVIEASAVKAMENEGFLCAVTQHGISGFKVSSKYLQLEAEHKEAEEKS